MKGFSRHIFASLLLALFCMAGSGKAYAQTLTCGTNGAFGTVNTQATISGTHNLAMSTTGAITYDAALNGPASGTPITCTLTAGGNKFTYDVECDASRTITNSGGCCGATDRNMTVFKVKAVGHATGSDLAETNCLGLGTSSGTIKTTAAGDATFTISGTMDATHVKIGSSYLLSNHATGPVNLQVRRSGVVTGPATADFSVTFNSLVGFTSTTGMNFGNSSAPSPPTAADHSDLGTDGTIAYSGGFSLLAGGTVSAGQVTMNNVQNGVTLEVYCDTTATLARDSASSNTIQVTGVKVAPEGSTGTYAGAGTACAGTGTVATTMSYTSGSADQFFFGGVLDGGTATNFNPGVYRSSNAGGTNMTVIVLNQ